MERLFGPDGALADCLPAFEPRAEQAELAAAVAEALARREHLLAEAGTGTGKSLAYLIPALSSGESRRISVVRQVARSIWWVR